jgi:hypothetical protein
MTTDRRISVEGLLVAGLLVLGLSLRFFRPAVPPLGETESKHAILAALETAAPPSLAGMAALGAPTDASYHGLTVVLFQGFGSGDLGARFIPILAGLMLVLLPLLVRQRIGRWETLVAIFLIALSPAMITVSRTAGGRSIALLGIAFAGLCLLDAWGGATRSHIARLWPIGVGLAASSGASGWTGLLVVLLAAIAFVLLRRRASGAWEWPASDRWGWLAALGTMLVVSSGLGLAPGGLRALASGLGAWMKGWADGGMLGILPFVLALLVYEPLSTVIGIAHAGRAIRRPDAAELWLLAWAIAGLVVPLLYPAREAADLVWCAFPLALLASKEASALVAPDDDSMTAISRVAMVAVLVMLGAFAYLQLSAFAIGLAPGFDPLGNPTLSLLFGMLALGLGIVMLLLFALGWSREAAFHAGSQAAWALLLVAVLAAIWRLNFAEPAMHGGDLWHSEATSAEQAQLRRTLAMVSVPTRVNADPVTLMAEGDLPASLVWTLRDLPIVPSLGYQLEASPAILLTPATGTLPLPSDYVGQTFTLSERRAWGLLTPSEAVTWWLRGTGPTLPQRWIVLVRSDLAGPDVIPPENQ